MSIKVEINDYGNSYVIERNGFCATIKRVEAESLCRDLADALGWDKLDELRAERDSALAAANHNLSCTAKAVAELEEAKRRVGDLERCLLDAPENYDVHDCNKSDVYATTYACTPTYSKWLVRRALLLAGAGAKPSEVCPKHPDRRVLPGERCFDCVTDERAGDTKQCEHCRGEGYSECQCLPADESAGVDTEPYAFLAGHDYPITALPVGSRFTCGPVTTTILGVCADGCVKVDHDGEDGHFNKDALVRFIGTAPPVAKQAEGRPSDAERQQVVDTLVANFSSLAEPVRKLLAYTKRLEEELTDVRGDYELEVQVKRQSEAESRGHCERAEAAERNYKDLELGAQVCREKLERRIKELEDEADKWHARARDLADAERDSGGERRTYYLATSNVGFPRGTRNNEEHARRDFPGDRIVKVTELRQPLSAAAVEVGDE